MVRGNQTTHLIVLNGPNAPVLLGYVDYTGAYLSDITPRDLAVDLLHCTSRSGLVEKVVVGRYT